MMNKENCTTDRKSALPFLFRGYVSLILCFTLAIGLAGPAYSSEHSFAQQSCLSSTDVSVGGDQTDPRIVAQCLHGEDRFLKEREQQIAGLRSTVREWRDQVISIDALDGHDLQVLDMLLIVSKEDPELEKMILETDPKEVATHIRMLAGTRFLELGYLNYSSVLSMGAAAKRARFTELRTFDVKDRIRSTVRRIMVR